MLDQIDAQVEEEVDTFQLPLLPPYLSPWRGSTKLPKDLDITKAKIQASLLLDDIKFKGLPLGHVPSLKFEYYDLADSDKFLELAKDMLWPRVWLLGVEKVGILNLRWLPHYHHMTITTFVIWQLLCLVHDGFMWFEEPILITTELIH